MLDRLLDKLRQVLAGNQSARPLFLAPELSYGRHHGPPAHDARRAAVLLLLYPDPPTWRIPLTVRPTHLPHHGGQVSLPGGQLEPGETPERGAARELEEELGIRSDQIEILGRLAPVYVFASNFNVVPVIAATRTHPQFEPSPGEVASLLLPSLVELSDLHRRDQWLIERHGLTFRAPIIRYDSSKIWGATCVILEDFLRLWRAAE